MPNLLDVRAVGKGGVRDTSNDYDPVGRAPIAATPYGPQGVTGNRYIDQGSFCETHQTDRCFLQSDQRARLIQLFGERVSAAGANYQTALLRNQIDQLVEKEDDLPWVATLVLEVIGGHLLKVAVAAASGALVSAAEALERANVSAKIRGAVEAMSKIEPSDLKAHVALVIAKGKKSAEARIKKAANAGAKSQRRSDADYLVALSGQASSAYQAIRELMPALATDAELVAAFDSFDVAEHSVDRYTQAIAEKVARYRKSGVPEIGRTDATYTQRGERVTAASERRVAWARFASGHARELMYVDRIDDMEGRPEPVPVEFREAALAQHMAHFGEEPETIHIDDSGYFWDPKRAGRAQAANPFRRAAQRVQDAHDAEEAGLVVSGSAPLLASADRSRM